jgi:Flp pilus assembly protein TadG
MILNKGENGVAAIEFALLLPFLLMVLFGIIEFSILLYNKAMITNASREGARAGILFRPSDDRLTADQIRNVVRVYAESYLITFGAHEPPEITPVNNNDNGDGVVPNSGDSLTVTVTYTYDFLILPSLVSEFLEISTLTAVSVMRYE